MQSIELETLLDQLYAAEERVKTLRAEIKRLRAEKPATHNVLDIETEGQHRGAGRATREKLDSLKTSLKIADYDYVRNLIQFEYSHYNSKCFQFFAWGFMGEDLKMATKKAYYDHLRVFVDMIFKGRIQASVIETRCADNPNIVYEY